MIVLEMYTVKTFGKISNIMSQKCILNMIKNTSQICQRGSEELFTIL